MGLKDKMKVNKVSLDFSNYYFYLKGVEKSGKTTLARDLTLELYGRPEAGLLLAIGKEVGYKALDNIQAIDAPEWEDFEEIVDDLIENYDEYKDIKMIYIDTIDELVELAEKETLRYSFRTTGKKSSTLNSALGGYGAGRKHVAKIIDEKLSALNNLYGLMVIGHTKLKTIKEQGMVEEQEYQILDSNLNKDLDGIVAHKADCVAVINVEREVNNTTKRINSTKRYVYFRNNGFVNAGTRFGNIVEKVELSAKNFITAIEDAIRGSMSTPMTDNEYKEAKKEEIEINKAKQQEFANEYVAEVDISIDELKELMKNLEADNRKKVIAKVKELEINIKEIESEDINKLKKLMKFIKTL